MRVFISAFGDPGHAFPAIALSRELASRGASVWLETAERWRFAVADTDIEFAAAPEFPVFPAGGNPLSPYAAVAEAVPATRAVIEQARPDVVVHDILTLAPALAAEQLEIKVATLIPHLSPVTPADAPPFGIGARPARTRLARGLLNALNRPISRGLDLGLREYNELRARLSLAPREGHHAALSQLLVLVATFPQLEYSLPQSPRFHITGPLFWEPDYPDVELPEGTAPLILVAPSTAQDPDHRLLRACLEGLGGLNARVLATWNRRPLENPPRVPRNMKFVEWVSYSRTMPLCDCVVSHGGHGTIARTLQAGAVPVVSAFAGDQFENAARIDATGFGLRLPRRLVSPGAIRLAVERALADPGLSRRCAEVSAWSAEHDGAAAAAELVLAAA